jgi:hypothetical protein
MERIGDDRPEGIGDDSLLEIRPERGLVVLRNARRLRPLAREHRHAGVVTYTDRGVRAGEFAGAIRRIDPHVPPAVGEGGLFWLTQWLATTG